MGLPTHEANGNAKDRSGLTLLRGIGAARKHWLNSLGIETIAHLAQASADAIEAQAKSDGRSLSRDELDAWIVQAQHHVQASLEPAVLPPIVTAIAPASDSHPLVTESTDAVEPPLMNWGMDWETVASFKVDYQTRSVDGKEQRLVMHHLETDSTESWSACEAESMQQWMRDRVEATSRRLQETAIDTDPIVAEITQLRVLQPHYMTQPMTADRHSPIFSDVIQTSAPFALEVSMQFAGSTTPLEKPIAYRVQCLARHLATGTTDSLGDVTSQVALANHSTYEVLLPSLRLRQPGTYRLKVLVTLQQASAASDSFKVPMLQVV